MAEIPVTTIKKLSIVHKVLLFGQIIFALVAVYLVYSGQQLAQIDKETDKILQVAVIAFSAAGFFIGTMFFKKKIMSVRETASPPAEKFAVYRTASLIQWALLEAPCLFSLICFMLTGNYALLILAAVLMICFVMLAPTRVKAAFQLGLSEDEL